VPLHEYLRQWAIRQPDKDALIYYGKRFSYMELDQIVDRLATALHDLGVNKGDKVTIFLPNCPQYLFSYFALQRIGAVLVSANPMFKKIELSKAMKSTDSKDITYDPYIPPDISQDGANTNRCLSILRGDCSSPYPI